MSQCWYNFLLDFPVTIHEACTVMRLDYIDGSRFALAVSHLLEKSLTFYQKHLKICDLYAQRGRQIVPQSIFLNDTSEETLTAWREVSCGCSWKHFCFHLAQLWILSDKSFIFYTARGDRRDVQIKKVLKFNKNKPEGGKSCSCC